MKYRFIFNPRSGHNARDPHLLQHTSDFIVSNGLEATIVATERPRHATELAHRAVAEGCDVVVAIGGDGTMNEVASALLNSPSILGLVPCGSGNGLGRHLGIYGSKRHIFQTLLTGRPRSIDTGNANGHPFFNVMGLGFDAEISERFGRLDRRGFTSYVRTTLATLRSFEPIPVKVRADGDQMDVIAFIAAVANSDQYGSGCYIAPGARVDDGLLDMTVLKPPGLFRAIPLLVRLFAGSVESSSLAVRLRAQRFTIIRPNSGMIHTDGEVHQTGAEIEIIANPKSLRVLVPASANCP